MTDIQVEITEQQQRSPPPLPSEESEGEEEVVEGEEEEEEEEIARHTSSQRSMTSRDIVKRPRGVRRKVRATKVRRSDPQGFLQSAQHQLATLKRNGMD